MAVSSGDRVKRVRVSLGTAIVLGLGEGKINAEPTTAYLLTYFEGRCTANCAFCPQARGSSSRTDMLSRVIWPDFEVKDVTAGIKRAFEDGKIERVCIQALNYPGVQDDILSLVKSIHSECYVPISVSCQPLNPTGIRMLAEAGVDRVSIALDAATEKIFSEVKGEGAGGPYRWDRHLEALRSALQVLGRGRVTTHLIAGLGESEKEFIYMVQKCHDMGVFPAVFAFTPIPGTRMANYPRPPIDSYRRIQVAHYIITRSLGRYEKMRFKNGRLIDFGISGEDLKKIILSGEPFLTSGCPGCNRPYYNEEPRGPIYNFPRKPSQRDIMEIMAQIGIDYIIAGKSYDRVEEC
ncbi:MAG: radical SAM protein [Candidatus Bathyarchaeia archaeon]|nr:radical SAM protein [Candidatus Bathyarchaeota archaeon]